jgi:uncharacterized Zn-binding protein involved in type VI secretion
MGQQLVSRETDSLSTGHICAATTTLDSPGQSDVYCEGLLVARVTDPTVAHPFPPAPPCAPHVASVNVGSPTVYCHGKKVTFITASADAGGMTGGNGTVWVATNAQAIAEALGVEVFAPLFPDTPDLPPAVAAESYAAEAIEGRQTEEADGQDPDTFELGEYGDGGLGGSARFANTSPTNQVEGVQNTPAAEGQPSDSPGVDATGTPGLNFLPHTDPRILPELRTILENVAAVLNTTLDITSAYRAPEYNENVGGVKNSQHMLGKACDISQAGWSESQRANFIQVCYDAGIQGFGVYNSFTHVDIGGKRAWGNSGSRTSLPRYPWAQAVLGPLGYATS